MTRGYDNRVNIAKPGLPRSKAPRDCAPHLRIRAPRFPRSDTQDHLPRSSTVAAQGASFRIAITEGMTGMHARCVRRKIPRSFANFLNLMIVRRFDDLASLASLVGVFERNLSWKGRRSLL